MFLRASLGALVLFVVLSVTAEAVPTVTFKVSTFDELNKGQPQGTLISSQGEVIAGRTATRLKAEAAMVWVSARDAAGNVYFGTGDEGKLLTVRGKNVRTLASLKTVLITSLVPGPGGKLVAGTLPDARILEVDPKNGKWRELSKLPARHVWALLYSQRDGRIYAASGAPGRIYALPAGGGKPVVHYDPGEKHLLCLAQESGGALLAGSSDKAILYRVTGKDRAVAVHDFDATELRKVVVAADGTLYLGVNQFQRKTSGLPRFDRADEGEEGTTIKVDKDKDKKPPKVRPQELRPGAKTGKGAVYRIDHRGNVDQLLALEKAYVTDMDLDTDQALWVGDGSQGKVYIIRKDRTVLTAFDLPERQVLALAVSGREKYMGTGDAGAIYRISDGPQKGAAYLSEVFDAKFPSTWGNLHVQASGKLHWESRSGNTAKPDKTWTGFRPVRRLGLEMSRLTSPSGRYLQLKSTWIPPYSGVLRSFTAYFRPLNQEPVVKEIVVGHSSEADKDKEKEKSKEGGGRTPKIKISWKVDNPDEDELVYRLYLREEMGLTWRKISGIEPLEKTEMEWDTEPVPEGYYRIKVVASDERANPPETTQRGSRISRRILVDNRKPEIVGLVVRHPWATGMAKDSYSTIRRIEFSLDGRPWRLVGTLDGIYDSPSESFRFRLPDRLGAGSHNLAVRAVDEAGNMGVSQVHFVRQHGAY